MHLHLVIMLQKHYYFFFFQPIPINQHNSVAKVIYQATKFKRKRDTKKKIIFLRQAFKKTIVDWKKVQKWYES